MTENTVKTPEAKLPPFKAILAAILATWTSKKLWMTLLGISILQGLYWHSAYWLIKSVPADKVVAYNDMFQTNHMAVVAAILTYLGVQGVAEMFRRNVTSTTMQIAEKFVSEATSKSEHIEHVIIEGAPGAPERKPFAHDACSEA